jgi:hypothetical protein
MRRFVFFSAFLLAIILHVFPVNPLYVHADPQSKIHFAFVIGCDLADEPGKICLLGAFKLGIKVTLLEAKRPKICISKTSEFTVADSVNLMKVSPAAHCGLPNQYGIAILEAKVDSYEIIELEEISDKKKVESMDKLVRVTVVLQNLLEKEQGLIPGKIDALSDILPKVYRYPIPKIEAFIVAYDKSADVSGPRAILINGVPYPLTGWCSYPHMRAFGLNGEYYLESGSYCCGCGITVKELFKIEPTGLVAVCSNDSLSD